MRLKRLHMEINANSIVAWKILGGYCLCALMVMSVARWFVGTEHALALGIFFPVALFFLLLRGSYRLLSLIGSQLDNVVWHVIKRKRAEDEFGELWDGPFPSPRAERDQIRVELLVTDKTGEHWVRVPPQMETPRQAVAWTYGKDVADYNPLVRT